MTGSARMLAAAVVSGFALAAAPASADASATLLEPVGGVTTTSEPNFGWDLPAGENLREVEVSPDPRTASGGSFVSNTDSRHDLYSFGSDREFITFVSLYPNDPLFAGTWFWHVRTRRDGSNTDIWSAVESFEVADEPPELHLPYSVKHQPCSKKIAVKFNYSDNANPEFMHWQVEFMTKRNGPVVAKIAGEVDHDGTNYATARTPSKLKPGTSYKATLTITDVAGQSDELFFYSIPIRRC